MNNVAKTQETRPAPEPQATPRRERTFRPLTDIVETEAGFSLLLEMPGVAADGVEIDVEGRVLSVRGRPQPLDPGDYRLVQAEYDEGSYERAFTLSEQIDPGRIEAEMRDGVLTLSLPRAEEARPQRIPVRSGR